MTASFIDLGNRQFVFDYNRGAEAMQPIKQFPGMPAHITKKKSHVAREPYFGISYRTILWFFVWETQYIVHPSFWINNAVDFDHRLLALVDDIQEINFVHEY